VGQPERETQQRAIALFRDELHYLANRLPVREKNWTY
jgi:hypothetical protein